VLHEENVGKGLSQLYLNGKNRLQSRRNLVDRIHFSLQKRGMRSTRFRLDTIVVYSRKRGAIY